ncbi:MAG: pyruvate, phosphate dikinase [Synergistales bacterium]|nr:pyruvate, phosphate dikinase [Synergistales bacterium]
MMKNKNTVRFMYTFDEGRASMRSVLGGKGANLAEMSSIGIPVPPGFTLTTQACLEYLNSGDSFIEDIWKDVISGIGYLEDKSGKTFGAGKNPLLVSVRSGAPVSMPGMMDTILNLGLNSEIVQAMIDYSGNERFVLDCYRRFIQMFSDVVMRTGTNRFEFALERKKNELGISYDFELDPGTLRVLIDDFRSIYRQQTKSEFPEDPEEQLKMAVKAVFNSWDNQRARTYRKMNGIDDSLGTAVNIVAMVYGNISEDSGTGVCFSRSPSNGEKKLYGEYLLNAQGEDVVAGIRTPRDIDSLQEYFPDVYRDLVNYARTLEEHYLDMQDIEFTVEKGKLYILQTRTGKRSASSAVNIAVDMVSEGLIDKETCISRVGPDQVEMLLHDQFDPKADYSAAASGLPASPGAAVGKIVFDPDEAVTLAEEGTPVILVRPETTPDDVHGLYAAAGVLTSRGGMTSHAAVVARGIGKPCITGCEGLEIDLEQEKLRISGQELSKGDILSIDGTSGIVVVGEVSLSQAEITDKFERFLQWCDETASLEVWANADTPEDAARARAFGAKGIGLCRTEHMFMAQERLQVMQQMIISDNTDVRREHLSKLQSMQKEDFKEIYGVMEEEPVIIRLLDPPLHEFLPDRQELKRHLSELEKLGAQESDEAESVRKTLEKSIALEEANPMLGFRGCRLGIVHPEIYEMQVRAILDAATELRRDYRITPYIMIPIVMLLEEFTILKTKIEGIVLQYKKEYPDLEYRLGTMIELPRAATVADELAREADFFSFGTNDLTQTTMGLSRDDAEAKFLRKYVEIGLLPFNPFNSLDLKGVGVMMEMAVTKARSVKQDFSCGICGEHGGDPRSISFCHSLGLHYVSCSPYRIPVARVAAAHASLGKQ